MGGTEAFPDLGSHCNLPTCHQLDFLPFRCDSCRNVFCLEHRSYEAHSCSHAGMKDATVILCPLCAGAVKRVFNEPADITLQKHLLSSYCDPSNYQRVMKKPRCPVSKCRQTLTFSNSHVCKSCHLKTCLKHRFPSDHACNNSTPAGKEAGQLAVEFATLLSKRRGTECKSSSSILGSKAESGSSTSVEAH